MKPLLRTIGTAALAAALLNASAGLCFCHRGPAGAEAASESSACCHGPQASAGTTVGTPASCCHIESAESSATPTATAQVAPPAASFSPVGIPAAALVARPATLAAVSSTSPPILALRI